MGLMCRGSQIGREVKSKGNIRDNRVLGQHCFEGVVGKIKYQRGVSTKDNKLRDKYWRDE